MKVKSFVFTLSLMISMAPLFAQEEMRGLDDENSITQAELRTANPVQISMSFPGWAPSGLQVGYSIKPGIAVGLYGSPGVRSSANSVKSDLLHPVLSLSNYGNPLSLNTIDSERFSYGAFLKYFVSDSSGWYIPVVAGFTSVIHEYETFGNGYRNDDYYRVGSHEQNMRYADILTGIGYKHWFHNGFTLEYGITGGVGTRQSTHLVEINKHLYINNTGAIDVNESVLDYLTYRQAAWQHNEKNLPLLELSLQAGFAF